jgi:tetratricopeptide (TPR) repeat protein
MAEQVGDVSLLSVVFGNMRVLSTRLGNLVEAEARFKQGLELSERSHGSVYISLLNGYLATVLQDQGKLDAAIVCIRRALNIGREMNLAACFNFGLIVLAYMRMRLALRCTQEDSSSLPVRTRLLTHAQLTVHRALAFEGLEAEMKTEGQIVLAQLSLVLGEVEAAQQQLEDILEEAGRYELSWLLAGAQRLLGAILAARGQPEEASTYFEQALQFFRSRGMRLEWARTLQSYAASLLQQGALKEQADQRGLSYLREAQQMFQDCHAALDLEGIERMTEQALQPAQPRRKSHKQEA